ncbi:class I glutamine amidotransferase-like protein [Flagelloscypha sp. PMI_526]|nr:class I glutamine amidotransferase-like protein [Flagelloscypha sp. PMI_526]
MKLLLLFGMLFLTGTQGIPDDVPRNFGIVLFDSFQALDAFGPLDVLNGLSFWSLRLNLALLSETMDPVLTPLRTNVFGSSFSEYVLPTHTFDNPPEDLEVLIVPGGGGTRFPEVASSIDFVRNIYPSLRYLITVCTGAGIAARAGVLDGKNATTNKKAWNQTTALGPNVNWIPVARWVVDGNIYSSSGVSAGIDAMFGFVSDIYGEDIADFHSHAMEYERHTDPSWDPFSAYWNVTQPADLASY